MSTKLHGFSTYKAFKLFFTGKTEKNRNSSKIGQPPLDLMAGYLYNDTIYILIKLEKNYFVKKKENF